MSGSLNGPIVVTGAGSGIGRALVLALTARGYGPVIAADRNFDMAIATASDAGNKAIATILDVSDAEMVSKTVAGICQEHGPISAFFSNAGINSGNGLGEPEEWHRTLDVNLMGHVHAARAALPTMEAKRRGTFVITASAAGLLMDFRTATYTVSKHAAVSLAEWLSVTVGDGVSIHCVVPEGVLTAMTRPDSHQAAAGIQFLSAEAVAEATVEGVLKGDFMIFTHPSTAQFEQRRVDDRPRWLNGMRRARRASLETETLFPCDDRIVT